MSGCLAHARGRESSGRHPRGCECFHCGIIGELARAARRDRLEKPSEKESGK
jgi:hypothetical protein